MALPRAEAELLFLRVLGLLRNPNSQHDPRQIALDYYRHQLSTGPSYNFSEYLSVALSAARSYEAASGVRADPMQPVVPPRGATDPTAFPGSTGYQYRVVVDVYENGVHVGSTAVNVTSGTPLSASDIGDRAIDVALGNLPGRDSVPGVQFDDRLIPEMRTTVITAGRIV